MAGWVWTLAAAWAVLAAGAAWGGGYAADAARVATRSTVEQREARRFIRHAAEWARFEIEASRLAESRAQSPRVRAFAADLLTQQEAALPELQRLLHARSMALPMLDNAQRKSLERMRRWSGARFDREYIEAVALRQQRDKLPAFERAAASAADPALQAWASSQLPGVRQHTARAGRLGPQSTGSRAGSATQRVL